MTEATGPVYEADLLRETGNGPTVPTETQILEDIYGPADESGVYGVKGVCDCGGDCE